LASRVAQRKDVEDVRARPSDLLTKAIAEDDPLPCSGQDHVELRIAGGVKAERLREMHFGQDDRDVLRGDDFAIRGIDLAHAVIGSSGPPPEYTSAAPRLGTTGRSVMRTLRTEPITSGSRDWNTAASRVVRPSTSHSYT